MPNDTTNASDSKLASLSESLNDLGEIEGELAEAALVVARADALHDDYSKKIGSEEFERQLHRARKSLRQSSSNSKLLASCMKLNTTNFLGMERPHNEQPQARTDTVPIFPTRKRNHHEQRLARN